jgi:hypothetical protein
MRVIFVCIKNMLKKKNLGIPKKFFHTLLRGYIGDGLQFGGGICSIRGYFGYVGYVDYKFKD